MPTKKSKSDSILDWLVGQALKQMPNADPTIVRELMKKQLEAHGAEKYKELKDMRLGDLRELGFEIVVK